jgi:hypothetical protein
MHPDGGQLERQDLGSKTSDVLAQRAVAAAMPLAAAPGNRVAAPVAPQAAVPAKASLARFRSDGRCGPNFPAPGAPSFGECDPKEDADQKGPCCNPESGWCGNIRQVDWGKLVVLAPGHVPRLFFDSVCHDFTPSLSFLFAKFLRAYTSSQVIVTVPLVSTTVGAA